MQKSEKSGTAQGPARPPSTVAPQYWFIYCGDKIKGPFSAEGVLERIQSGKHSWVDFIWGQGLESWARICDLDEFRVRLPAAPYPETLDELREAIQSSPELKEKVGDIAKCKPESSSPICSSSEVAADQAYRLVDHDEESESSSEAGDAKPVSQLDRGPWFLLYQGTEVGPFSSPELDQMIQGGNIQGEVKVRSCGQREWVDLSEIITIEGLGIHMAAVPKKNDLSKRNYERVPMIARVYLGEEASAFIGICHDISAGGTQILSNRCPVPAGTKAVFLIVPAASLKVPPFKVEGRVMRMTDGGKAFSIKFESRSPEAEKCIQRSIEVMKERTKTNAAAVPKSGSRTLPVNNPQ